MAFVTWVKIIILVSLVDFGVCVGEIWSVNSGILMSLVCYA